MRQDNIPHDGGWRRPSTYRDRHIEHAAEEQSSRVRRVLRRGLQRTDYEA